MMMWVGPTSTLYQNGDVELADCQGDGYRWLRGGKGQSQP